MTLPWPSRPKLLAPRKKSAGRRNAGGVITARRNLRPVSKSANLDRAGAGDDVAVAQLAVGVETPRKESAGRRNAGGVIDDHTACVTTARRNLRPVLRAPT
jgi:hypothetical protein